jgi:hypothetical protein
MHAGQRLLRRKTFRYAAGPGLRVARTGSVHMTDRIALGLAVLLTALAALDFAMNDGTATLFLVRKLLDAVEWIAFWR